MSTSNAQLAANIANAKLSTGPRTEPGKQRSSQNAVRHGLFARISPAAAKYQACEEQYTAEFQPQGKLETDLIATITSTQLRLERCRLLQDPLLDELIASPQVPLTKLDKFGLYETRLNRILQTSLKSLREAQDERKQAEEKALAEAAAIAKSFESKQMQYDPREDGFVFSASELASYIRRNDRLDAARTDGFRPSGSKARTHSR